MVIVWDEVKRDSNLRKHQLDFADLTEAFFIDALVLNSRSGRFKAINVFRDTVVTVVFAHLGNEGISVISMRPASRKERNI